MLKKEESSAVLQRMRNIWAKSVTDEHLSCIHSPFCLLSTYSHFTLLPLVKTQKRTFPLLLEKSSSPLPLAWKFGVSHAFLLFCPHLTYPIRLLPYCQMEPPWPSAPGSNPGRLPQKRTWRPHCVANRPAGRSLSRSSHSALRTACSAGLAAVPGVVRACV
jgi:hypothetical protein